MTAYDSYDAYDRFAREIVGRARFVWDDVTQHFLDSVLAQAHERVDTIGPNIILWRAQVGHEFRTVDDDNAGPYDVPAPLPPARMTPLSSRAREGRANPKGIPCLYLATHLGTAIAEVRPWIGSEVSVGQFVPTRELRLVNCTEHEEAKLFLPLSAAPPDSWDTRVWCAIDYAFSRPLTPSDDEADYAPTQVLAELLMSGGFDGIAYASSLGDGHNVALFDLDAAVLTGCGLYRVKAMGLRFEESASPYVIEGSDERPASG